MDNQDKTKALAEQMSKIKNTIVVLSGKGGVGKSTVAVNLAVGLSMKGYKTGLLDVDVHGPSVPTLLGLELSQPESDGTSIFPVKYNENLKVISVGFMLEDINAPIVWRGPLKMSYIQQMLSDVEWGELDYLIVDCPPGTGDEPLGVMQTIKNPTSAVIVTTPQRLAIVDVKKSVNFCKKLNTRIVGIVENMSGFVCPDCGKVFDIFKTGGGENLAQEMNVPFLGKIPLESKIVESDDEGTPYIEFNAETQTAKEFNKIIEKIIA